MRISIDKYIQILNNIFQMGVFYAAEGDDEKHSFLRIKCHFLSIAVEELPLRKDVSATEQISIDAKIIEALATAEFYKSKIRRRYEQEAQSVAKKDGQSTSSNNDSKIVFNPSMAEWGISEEKLAPYILCNETSIHPIVFQRVIIPNNLPQSFLNATENKFRFAFLYGKLVRNSLIASHALVASVEDINNEKFERFMGDPEAEVTYLLSAVFAAH
uniref:Uncharacterized protein n=1 Tax=Ditylenchus dipsaci TaxID=166011 RepID=A0A915D1V9_9BILA